MSFLAAEVYDHVALIRVGLVAIRLKFGQFAFTAARCRECVYVLQSVFLLSVFSVRHNEVHKYETTVLGNG